MESKEKWETYERFTEKADWQPGLLRVGAGPAGAHDRPTGHHPVCQPSGQRDGGAFGHSPHVRRGHCQPDHLHLQPDHFRRAGRRLPLWGAVRRQERSRGGALHPALPAGVQRGGVRPGHPGLSSLWGAAVPAVLEQGVLFSGGDRLHFGLCQGVHRHHALWASAFCHKPVLFQHPAGCGRDLLSHGGQPPLPSAST